MKRKERSNLYSFCKQEHKNDLYWHKMLACSTVVLCSHKTCCWPVNTFFVIVERSLFIGGEINVYVPKSLIYSRPLRSHVRTHNPHKGKTVLSPGLILDCVWKVFLSVETWTEQLNFGVVWFPHQRKETWAEQEGGERGSWRKGAIPHQQALSPPEVYECVCVIESEEEVCRGVVRGMAKPTVQLFKMFQKKQKQADILYPRINFGKVRI